MSAALARELSLASRVRIRDDVVFHDLGGEIVILNLETGVYFGLDPAGTRIWQLVREHASLRAVRDALLEEYAVAEPRCTDDLLQFITRLRENDLVEIVE
ncbi:MAG: PqqD family protein [Candidatus Rokubacteria bacterium]|nr:PqqD family protein [Candidatus Rokubacteria bacterium]